MIGDRVVTNERVEEIEKLLIDYSWMISEIKRLRPLLEKDENKGMRQLDMKGILPKPQGMTNNPISNEVFRGNRRYKRLISLEKNVLFIQNRMHAIVNEREVVILNCLLDGMSISDTARHIELSRTQTHRIRRGIARTIATADPEPISLS